MFTKMRQIYLAIGLLSVASTGFAAEPFFQCGPDEGGCRKGEERFCLCIPANENFENSAFCLNFDDNMSCSAIDASDAPCPADFTFKNQGECLAVLYQSMIKPDCKMVSKEKCQADHSYFCDASGDPMTCQHEDA